MSSSHPYNKFPGKLPEESLLEKQYPIYEEHEKVVPEVKTDDIKIKAIEWGLKHKSHSLRQNCQGVYYALYKRLLSEKKPSAKDQLEILNSPFFHKRISTEVAFGLALECLRRGNARAFASLLAGVKRHHPLHPDLVSFKTQGGDSLAHLACLLDARAFLKVILAMGQDYVEAPNYTGETPAHVAARHGSLACLRLLTNTTPKLFRLLDQTGRSPGDYLDPNQKIRLPSPKTIQKDLDNSIKRLEQTRKRLLELSAA